MEWLPKASAKHRAIASHGTPDRQIAAGKPQNWNFTRLGKLDMNDAKEIRKFLNAGNGKAEIVLSLLK